MKEEGYAWPCTRQRLAEPAARCYPNSSSLVNVARSFPDLVNGESSSSEWSNWHGNGSHHLTTCRENGTSWSQIDNSTAAHWSTDGTNGLQTVNTESFEVEQVPYSSNAMETLRMVFNNNENAFLPCMELVNIVTLIKSVTGAYIEVLY